MGFSFFADHIRSLIQRFDSKLAGVENFLMRELSRPLADSRLTQVYQASLERTGSTDIGTACLKVAISTKWIKPCWNF